MRQNPYFVFMLVGVQSVPIAAPLTDRQPLAVAHTLANDLSYPVGRFPFRSYSYSQPALGSSGEALKIEGVEDQTRPTGNVLTHETNR